MQEELPGLTRELRKETCPQRVIDAALRRIAAETPQPSPLGYLIPAALAGIVVLCGLFVWSRRPADGHAGRQPDLAEQQTHRRTQAAREAETALVLIGTALRDAGAHSETVISDRAIPQLRHGFDTARNKLIHHREL